MVGLFKKLFKNWGVVQPAERVAVNHEVAGSSPATPATLTKGEKMSTKETKELKKELGTLKNRVNELVDEIKILKNDLSRFKSDVGNDVKYLTDRVDS
jgi:uncharacterized protein YlxW (UPF0749 family)